MADTTYAQYNGITSRSHYVVQDPLKMKTTEVEITEIDIDEDETTDIEVADIVIFEDKCPEPEITEIKITSNRDKLLAMISGRSIEVPDMGEHYGGWSRGLNPGYQAMIPLVNAKLESLLSHDEKKLAKAKRVDFALFAGTWWPRAAWHEYVIVTYFSLWLFVWDDEIDMAVGDLSFDYQAAQDFRLATLRFVSHTLGFGTSDTVPLAPNPIISSFKVIADALCEAYTDEQRKIFLDEIAFFLKMSQMEQEYRLGDRIPSVEEYWACRMGTSAVGPCLAMAEFSERVNLPRSVRQSLENKIIWDESNIGIWIVNDILSLKKELSTGVIINLVPVLCNKTKDIQLAVDLALESLRSSCARLEAAVSRLLQHDDPALGKGELRGYIDVCMENSTGNLDWSFLSGRYGLAGQSRSDGSVNIDL